MGSMCDRVEARLLCYRMIRTSGHLDSLNDSDIENESLVLSLGFM